MGVEKGVASVALILLSPILAGIAIWLYLVQGRPVLYLAQRLGKNKQQFRMVKFRSMVVGADQLGPDVTAGDDPRITKIGARLRRWKIDELPTLWNVVKGEMAFVGPRPLTKMLARDVAAKDQGIWAFMPGITSPATLKYIQQEYMLVGVSDPEIAHQAMIQDKCEIELEYATKRNAISDLSIVVRTVLSLLRIVFMRKIN